MNSAIKILLLIGLMVIIAFGLNKFMADEKEDRLSMLEEAKESTVMILNVRNMETGAGSRFRSNYL